MVGIKLACEIVQVGADNTDSYPDSSINSMNKQSRWLFEAPLTLDKTFTNSFTTPDYLPRHELDAMAARLRGRSRLGSVAALISIYHYSPTIIRGAIKSFSKWTDMSFGSRSIQDVARITGLQVDKIKYRYEYILPRKELDQYFRNIATKMVPGLGSANEYVSQIPIPISWIEKVTLLG